MDDDTVARGHQELVRWGEEGGLVPKDMSDPEQIERLALFLGDIIVNEQPNPGYQIQRCAQQECKSPMDFELIDERTGTVVCLLTKTDTFEICDGVKLQIKAAESKKWEQETAKAKKLSKEQTKSLKTFVSKYGAIRPLTREEIVTFIEEIQKTSKPKKYRQSGHFVDKKLEYSQPGKKLSLFDAISSETKQKIEEAKIEVKAEGIKLTPPENKLIHALTKILHDKSPNIKKPKEEGFYSGNAPGELVPYGMGTAKAEVLKFKPSELYKAYLGHANYSGKEIKFINNILYQLESKKVLIKYDRIKKIRNKKTNKVKTLTDRIEDFQSLIHIKSFIPDLTNEEKQKLDKGDPSVRRKKGEIIVALNPILTDQIDTKFIEFPSDTNRRLVIAAGGHRKVTSSMMTLMEWMHREISAKRYNVEINEGRFPYILGLINLVEQKKKKRLQERISKDIEAVSNMGIILQTDKVPNSTGGCKWVFHLNKDYE